MADIAETPAVPVTSPLDRLFGAESEAGLAERVQKIVQGKPAISLADLDLQLPPAPAETPPTPPTEAPPEPAREEPPTPTAPESTVDESAPPIAASEVPAEGEPETPKKLPRWKDLRERDKAIRTLEQRVNESERENARLRGIMEATVQQRERPPAPEVPEALAPAESDDPVTGLEKRLGRLEQEAQILRVQTATQSLETNITQREAAFERNHPDYREALEYLIESERKESVVTGKLAAVSRELSARIGPDRFRQIVLDVAVRQGISEDEARGRIAFEAIINSRRNEIVLAAQAENRNEAESAYEMARLRGWKPKAEAPAVVEPSRSTLNRPTSAEVKEAAASLGTVPKTPAPPPARQIRSRAELDQHMAAMSVSERSRFIDAQDAADPDWLERLP